MIVAASEIQAVTDTHDWLQKIKIKLNDTESNLVRDIIDIASRSTKWNNYINPLREWLDAKKTI